MTRETRNRRSKTIQKKVVGPRTSVSEEVVDYRVLTSIVEHVETFFSLTLRLISVNPYGQEEVKTYPSFFLRAKIHFDKLLRISRDHYQENDFTTLLKYYEKIYLYKSRKDNTLPLVMRRDSMSLSNKSFNK